MKTEFVVKGELKAEIAWETEPKIDVKELPLTNVHPLDPFSRYVPTQRKLDASHWVQLSRRQELLRCEICSELWGHKSTLGKHMQKHRRLVPCAHCPDVLLTPPPNARYSRHMALHEKFGVTGRFYPCSLCDMKFRRSEHLATHIIRKHEHKFSFSCDVCGKVFRTHLDLTTHNRVHNSVSSPCLICGSVVKDRYLPEHIARTHQQKEFGCVLCERTFSSPKQLSTHERFSHMEPRFRCDRCDYPFASRSRLIRHASVHNPDGTDSHLRKPPKPQQYMSLLGQIMNQ